MRVMFYHSQLYCNVYLNKYIYIYNHEYNATAHIPKLYISPSQGLASPLPLAFVARGAVGEQTSEARMAAKASHDKREKQAAKVPVGFFKGMLGSNKMWELGWIWV